MTCVLISFFFFLIRVLLRRVRKIAKSDYLRHVCPSVRTDLGSHYTDYI